MLKILPRKKSSQRISSDQNHQEVSILPNYNYDNNLEDNINQFSTNLHNDNYDDNEFVNSDDPKFLMNMMMTVVMMISVLLDLVKKKKILMYITNS